VKTGRVVGDTHMTFTSRFGVVSLECVRIKIDHGGPSHALSWSWCAQSTLSVTQNIHKIQGPLSITSVNLQEIDDLVELGPV